FSGTWNQQRGISSDNSATTPPLSSGVGVTKCLGNKEPTIPHSTFWKGFLHTKTRRGFFEPQTRCRVASIRLGTTSLAHITLTTTTSCPSFLSQQKSWVATPCSPCGTVNLGRADPRISSYSSVKFPLPPSGNSSPMI